MIYNEYCNGVLNFYGVKTTTNLYSHRQLQGVPKKMYVFPDCGLVLQIYDSPLTMCCPDFNNILTEYLEGM